MKFRSSLFIGLIIFLSSCSSSLKVVNMRDANQTKGKGLVYFLPKTSLKVEVELTKTIQKEGPYRKYANKYLGILETDIIRQNGSSWSISNFNIKPQAEIDSSQCYLVQASEGTANLINLTKDGFLSSINGNNQEFENQQKTDVFVAKYEKIAAFTDLSIKRNLAERVDTVYSLVQVDTAFIRRPRTFKRMGKKSLEKKAEEAANFIIRTRKRRFKLLAGMYDKFPDGTSLKFMDKELDDLEDRYVELFAGKQFKVIYRYSFDFTPNATGDTLTAPLFYFSEKEGISEKKNLTSYPVKIQIIVSEKAKTLQSLNEQKEASKDNVESGIVYRVPDYSTVHILDDEDNILAKTKIQISQFGQNFVLPTEVLNDNYQIEFYSKTGALKNIKKTK